MLQQASKQVRVSGWLFSFTFDADYVITIKLSINDNFFVLLTKLVWRSFPPTTIVVFQQSSTVPTIAAVWFDQDSHATSDIFMFALNLKSFLKEHAIVMRTKEIIRFIARTNRKRNASLWIFHGRFGLLKALSAQILQGNCVSGNQTTFFISTTFWTQITQQISCAFIESLNNAIFVAPRRSCATIYCNRAEKGVCYVLWTVPVNFSNLNKQDKWTQCP